MSMYISKEARKARKMAKRQEIVDRQTLEKQNKPRKGWSIQDYREHAKEARKRAGMALVVLLLMGVVFTAFVSISQPVKAVQERSWIPLGTNQTFKGGSGCLYKGFVYCEPMDQIWFNWKAGDISWNQGYWVDFFTTIPAYNWSDGGREYSPVQIAFWMTNGSAWIRSGAYDSVMISISSPFSSLSEQTFNVTVVKGTTEIKEKLSDLNDRLNGLNESISENLTILYNLSGNLSARMDESYSLLLGHIINLSIYESMDVQRLQSLIDVLNQSIQLLAYELQSRYVSMDQSIKDSVSNLSIKISELEGLIDSAKYNDTEIRNELTNLSAREMTNLTVINQTLVNQTLVNQTLLNQTLLNNTYVNQSEPVQYVNRTFMEPKDSSVSILATVTGVALVMSTTSVAISLWPNRRKPKSIPPPEDLSTTLH